MSIVLNPVGVLKGNSKNGFQYYFVVGKDADGDEYIMTFATKTCYCGAIGKAFSRFIPIAAPKDAEVPVDIPIEQPGQIQTELNLEGGSEANGAA